MRIQKPDRDLWESLGGFSRHRRSMDGWHYDIAAFPAERLDVYQRLWERYEKQEAEQTI